MDADKVKAVIEEYRKVMVSYGYKSVRADFNEWPESDDQRLQHVCYMLDKMEKYIAEDRMDKVFRWLGFVQGVFWCTGIFKVSELKNHVRTDQ